MQYEKSSGKKYLQRIEGWILYIAPPLMGCNNLRASMDKFLGTIIAPRYVKNVPDKLELNQYKITENRNIYLNIKS